jgi:hypothetical protein
LRILSSRAGDSPYERELLDDLYNLCTKVEQFYDTMMYPVFQNPEIFFFLLVNKKCAKKLKYFILIFKISLFYRKKSYFKLKQWVSSVVLLNHNPITNPFSNIIFIFSF